MGRLVEVWEGWRRCWKDEKDEWRLVKVWGRMVRFLGAGEVMGSEWGYDEASGGMERLLEVLTSW